MRQKLSLPKCSKPFSPSAMTSTASMRKDSKFGLLKMFPTKWFQWRGAALNWADKLRDDIGGDYRVTSSSESVVLSAESQEITDWIHNYISRSIRAISARRGDVAWRKNELLKLFLSFAEEDDYYHYIAPYCPDGLQAASLGICIGGGCPHVAFLMQTD